jgi:hypothetical protein
MSTARKPIAPPPATTSPHRRDDELEAWICKRLVLRDLFAGDTTREMRRDRLKVVLLERGLTESIAGRFDGKPITWRALFEKLFGEALTTTTGETHS